jgi:hypothetical protein
VESSCGGSVVKFLRRSTRKIAPSAAYTDNITQLLSDSDSREYWLMNEGATLNWSIKIEREREKKKSNQK